MSLFIRRWDHESFQNFNNLSIFKWCFSDFRLVRIFTSCFIDLSNCHRLFTMLPSPFSSPSSSPSSPSSSPPPPPPPPPPIYHSLKTIYDIVFNENQDITIVLHLHIVFVSFSYRFQPSTRKR